MLLKLLFNRVVVLALMMHPREHMRLVILLLLLAVPILIPNLIK